MKNIVFIGMPAVGKSTVGVVIAKRLGYKFVDTDILIQESEGKLLKDIIADVGPDGFLNPVIGEISVTHFQKIFSRHLSRSYIVACKVTYSGNPVLVVLNNNRDIQFFQRLQVNVAQLRNDCIHLPFLSPFDDFLITV